MTTDSNLKKKNRGREGEKWQGKKLTGKIQVNASRRSVYMYNNTSRLEPEIVSSGRKRCSSV